MPYFTIIDFFFYYIFVRYLHYLLCIFIVISIISIINELQGHGPSEADRVYAELIRNGATPAIVGKQRKDARWHWEAKILEVSSVAGRKNGS